VPRTFLAPGKAFIVTPRWPVVLFDLDGTVIDTIGLIVDSYQSAFTTVLGRPWDEAEIRTWIGQSLIEALHRADPERATELYAAYTAFNQAHAAKLTRNYPGVPELLRDLTLAGVRIGVVTSKRTASAASGLELTGLTDVLPLIVAHDDVDEHKPSPKPLLKAMATLGATPSETAYVGDAVVDVQAAHHAHVAAIAVTWGAGVREEIVAAGADHVADTVGQLRAVLGV
jgi:pyrophosphatase PpaX